MKAGQTGTIFVAISDGDPRPLPDDVEETAAACLQSAFRVHSELGARLLERAYREALAIELRNRGLEVETETPVPVSYRGEELGVGLRLDLRVEECLVIEVKSVDGLTSAHTAQTLTLPGGDRGPVGAVAELRRIAPPGWDQAGRPLIAAS